MSKRIYTEVLRTNFKSLGYFADELTEAKSDFEFFRVLAMYIVPLIRRSPVFEQIYFEWVKQKDTYLKTQKELQGKTPQEVENAYRSLKIILKTNNLLEDEKIKQRLDSIEEVFEKKHTYGTPSYVDEVYDRMRYLLSYLLDLGMIDVVKGYAVLIYEDRIIEFIGIKKVHIDHLKFAPSLIALRELQQVFGWNKVQDSWVAWEFVALVEWCWNTPFSFFDDKRENYESYQAGNESMNLWRLHSHWLELNQIKQSHSDRGFVSFFTRDRFLGYVKLIINEVILYQEANVTQLIIESEPNSLDVYVPFLIKLTMIGTRLLLDVYWSQNSDASTVFISEFQEESGPHKFFKKLLESPGKTVDVDVASGVSGATVAKFLDGANLNNILGELFFEKIKNQKTRKACMKFEEIRCQDLSKANQIELVRHIKRLREFAPKTAWS